MIEFVGLERSFLTDGGNLEPQSFQRESKEIIKLRQVSRVFKGAGIRKGQYAYPFQVYLPDWLPQSFTVQVQG